MLKIQTLGSLNLTDSAGQEITAVLSQPKRFALLAYLALARPDGFVRRDSLLTLFWPELGESRARNALSQSLSYLRKNLPSHTLTSRGTEDVGLEREALVIDVFAFQEEMESGRWAEALDLYGGEFLRGFHVAGAPAFEEWVHAERDRLREAAARCAWALARDRLREGSLGGAEKSARMALGLVCPDETTVRGFMEALTAAGDRVAALRLYRRFTAALSDTLDVEPTEEMKAFERNLRSGSRSPGAPSDESRDLPRWVPWASEKRLQTPSEGGRRFAGRESELSRLGGFLRKALEGKGAVAFVTGEAGTGKSSLSQEFCSRSMSFHPDLVRAVGHCDVHTGLGDPYHPFREILAVLTGDVEGEWVAGAMSTEHARRLWGLVPVSAEAVIDVGPDLLNTFIHVPPLLRRLSESGFNLARLESILNEVPVREDVKAKTQIQATLFHQYVRVLRRIARDRPLLLVVEDLQWADAGSLDLFFHLGRNLTGSRILLLGLYRPSEVSLGRGAERHHLEKIANEFTTDFGDISVSLEEEGDREFLDAVIDMEANALGADFREALFQRTRGHALFTSELLSDLRERGEIERGQTGELIQRSNLKWDLLPARVEAVIQERTSRLPKDLRDILMVASVEGDNFTLEVVAHVLGREPMDLLPLVSGELERRHGLVRIEGVQRLGDHRLSEYRFRHILFQQFLYERLDEAERVYLHEQVARALEDLFGPDSGEKALALARHYREAGLIEKAVDRYCAGAERAKNAGAFTGGLALLREARSLVQELPESPGRNELELRVLSSLSMVSWVLGMAVQDPDGILPRLKELAEEVQDHKRLFWALGCSFTRFHFLGEQDRAREVLQELSSEVARHEGSREVVQLQAWRGFNALQRGFLEDAVEYLERAEPGLATGPSSVVASLWIERPLPFALSLKALALGPMGYVDQASRCIEDAYRQLEQDTGAAEVFYVRLHDFLFRMMCCGVQEAESKLKEFKDAADSFGPGGWWALSHFAGGWCMGKKEKPREGAAVMVEALQVFEAHHWAPWRPYFDTLLAEAMGRFGELESGLALVEKSLLRIEEAGERLQEAEVHRIRGDLLLARHEADLLGAETAFRKAVTVARSQGAKLFELRSTIRLARLLRDEGQRREARRTLQECFSWFSEGFHGPDLKEARSLLAELG